MNRVKLLCVTKQPLPMKRDDGITTIIPSGKTLTLLDAYTQSDDINVAIVVYEEDGKVHLGEVHLHHIEEHLACQEAV